MTKKSITSSNFEISLEDELLRESSYEQFARRVTLSLEQNLDEIPPHVSERLQAARSLAVSKKKAEKSYAWNFAFNLGGGRSNGRSNSSNSSNGLWRSIGSIAPIIVLLVGLAGIAQWQEDARINDIADIDAALLSDEVPPDAYADDGFWVFLKNLANQDKEQSDASGSEAALNGR